MSLQDTYQTRKNLLASNLTAQGVTASGQEGLTSLIEKVMDIEVFGTITLTTNKNILSYYDSETATLTATYSRGEGYELEVYNAVTGVKVGDMVDNGDGTYSYTYNSTGVGDISMTATKGQTESNSVTIEDCTKYDTTEYTSNQNVQIALPTGDFEIGADLFATATNNSYPQLYIGTELNVNNIAFGQMSEDGYQGWEFKKNNSRLTLQQFNTAQSYNTYYNIRLTRVGNLYTLYWNNQTLTYTNTTIDPTYLFLIYLPYGKCKNIKIKPL